MKYLKTFESRTSFKDETEEYRINFLDRLVDSLLEIFEKYKIPTFDGSQSVVEYENEMYWENTGVNIRINNVQSGVLRDIQRDLRGSIPRFEKRLGRDIITKLDIFHRYRTTDSIIIEPGALDRL